MNKEGQTQEPVGGMKLLIDFINNFRADKKLKYSIACNVQAYLARFGVDISDNVRQKFQDDKCAEYLVDEVLDDMLNKVYEAKPPAQTEGETKQNISIEFAEWIPSSGFTQIAKRLGGYWFKSKDSKKYTTQDVFFKFLIDSGNASPCDVYGHDVIPMLGEENSIIGECCRVCGAKIDESNTPPPSPVGIDELADTSFFKINADPYYNNRLHKADFIVGFKAGYSASLPQSSTEEENKLWNEVGSFILRSDDFEFTDGRINELLSTYKISKI